MAQPIRTHKLVMKSALRKNTGRELALK